MVDLHFLFFYKQLRFNNSVRSGQNIIQLENNSGGPVLDENQTVKAELGQIVTFDGVYYFIL